MSNHTYTRDRRIARSLKTTYAPMPEVDALISDYRIGGAL